MIGLGFTTMRIKIRKYTIHILPVTAFKPGIFDLPPERNAIIVCTNRENEYLTRDVKSKILFLNFLDIEDPHAVAAALLRMSGRSDDPVWLSPFYCPNTLVYYILCREAEIPVSQIEVWIRKQQNRRAYLRARRGKPSKYERWQIID